LSKTSNIVEAMKKLIDENGLDFLNNYLLENKEQSIDLGIDFLYSNFLNNNKNIEVFLNIINENI
jgi:hypothetical protein